MACITRSRSQWAGLPGLNMRNPCGRFPSYRGQRNFPGLWWSATTGEHVGFESWLEREHAMMLDFDPDGGCVLLTAVLAAVARTVSACGGTPPDFFSRLDDGSALVVDVRADDQIPATDAEVFEVTASACALGRLGL